MASDAHDPVRADDQALADLERTLLAGDPGYRRRVALGLGLFGAGPAAELPDWSAMLVSLGLLLAAAAALIGGLRLGQPALVVAAVLLFPLGLLALSRHRR